MWLEIKLTSKSTSLLSCSILHWDKRQVLCLSDTASGLEVLIVILVLCFKSNQTWHPSPHCWNSVHANYESVTKSRPYEVQKTQNESDLLPAIRPKLSLWLCLFAVIVVIPLLLTHPTAGRMQSSTSSESTSSHAQGLSSVPQKEWKSHCSLWIWGLTNEWTLTSQLSNNFLLKKIKRLKCNNRAVRVLEKGYSN